MDRGMHRSRWWDAYGGLDARTHTPTAKLNFPVGLKIFITKCWVFKNLYLGHRMGLDVKVNIIFYCQRTTCILHWGMLRKKQFFKDGVRFTESWQTVKTATITSTTIAMYLATLFVSSIKLSAFKNHLNPTREIQMPPLFKRGTQASVG